MKGIERGKVLLVEDNEAVAESVTELLERAGAEVRRARSVAEARRAALGAFDVALVEVRLPDASGLELLSSLKRAGDGTAEVLLVTGYGSLEDAVEALHRGASAYLLKPIDPAELTRRVERAMRQVRSNRREKVLARKLEQKEASLRILVDNVKALLLVLDEDGRVVQANPAVESATGTGRGELVGIRWVERFVPESDRREVYEALAKARAGEEAACEYRILVGRGEGKSGVRWIRWHASPRETGDGGIWIYKSGIDTTEVRELERRARLSERMAAVGTLTAGLAHEVRNPLNAARLQLDLLQRRMEPDRLRPDVLGPLHLVKEEIGRLAELLEEFFQFARPAELVPAELDLGELARQTLEVMRPDAEAREIELQLDAPAAPVRLFLDEAKVRQVLVHLLRNALESVTSGGTVLVEVEPDGDGARLAVRDTGPGIPPEVRKRVFEPFFTTKSGGTGLGLAICHSLIAQHGGDIRVASGGETTELAVILPRRPPHSGRLGPRR